LPDSAREADLLLVAGANVSAPVLDLVAARRRAGRADRATIIDLAAGDLDGTGAGTEPVALSNDAARLVGAGGAVTSPGGLLHDLATAEGAAAFAMPSLVPRERYAALRYGASSLSPSEHTVVGWHVGRWTGVDALSEGLAKVLADRPTVLLDVVGDAAHLPPALRGHAQVRMLDDPPGADDLAHWAAHVWSPHLVQGAVVDGVVRFLEASCAAVPSVMAASARAHIDGWMSHEIVVEHADDPDEWVERLESLVDDERHRAHQGAEVRRRSNALLAPMASALVIERFLGWVANLEAT
jgi:hypothetical protein